MVTLTYPSDWQVVVGSRSELNKHWRAFKKLWERCWGTPLRCVWKLEFQRRGAPHLHLYTSIPVGLSRHRSSELDGLAFNQWLSLAWSGIVAHPDEVERNKHTNAGTAVDYQRGLAASDANRVASYFYKFSYLYKYTDADGKSKDYQHQPPPEWVAARDVGRFWGYCGLEKSVQTVVLSRDQFASARRVLRKVSASRSTPHSRVRLYEVDGATGEVVAIKPARSSFCKGSRLDGGLYGGFHLSPQGNQLGASIVKHLGIPKQFGDQKGV